MSFLWQEGYDIWIKNSLNTLPNTTWQHITFTMPEELWIFFWLNRSLLNRIPLIAATLIKDWAQTKGFLPGIFLAIHTFGRDLKKNIHIHLSTTAGGLSPCHTRWIGKAYFYHESLKTPGDTKSLPSYGMNLNKGFSSSLLISSI
ncbi:MAG: transposase [Candidatus Jettenia caeni]|nr:MAG: transposase [Candidatus Jettenia caeni]